MNIHFSLQAHSATISLLGAFDQATAIALRRFLHREVLYYHYDHLTVEINSPGGEWLALQQAHHDLSQWRQEGRTLETRALMTTGSAAALMLSLGDIGRRVAQSHSHLLYHHARVFGGADTVFTALHASAAAQHLQGVDSKMLNLLVGHIEQGFGGASGLARQGLKRCDSLLNGPSEAQWGEVGARVAGNRERLGSRDWTLDLRKAYMRVLKSRLTKPFTDLLIDLFARDQPLPPALAWGLLLIDSIECAPLLQPAPRLQSVAAGAPGEGSPRGGAISKPQCSAMGVCANAA